MWRSFDDFLADADPDDTLVTDNGPLVAPEPGEWAA